MQKYEKRLKVTNIETKKMRQKTIQPPASLTQPPITIGRKLIEKLMYCLIIVNRTRTLQKS